MNTCRLCKEDETSNAPLVKYSVRHYVHAHCAMNKWGAAFFDRLTPWQAGRFPYFIAKHYGHEKALEQRAAKAEGRP